MNYFNNYFSVPNVQWNNLSSHLSTPVKSMVLSVYTHLAQMLLVSSISSYISSYYNLYFLSNPIVSLVGAIGCSIMFVLSKEEHKKKGWSFGFAIFKGLTLAPLIQYSLYMDPSMIAVALSCTAIVFLSFSASVLMTESRQFMYVGGLLGSMMSVLGWMSLINFFMRSPMLFSLELYLGLFAFSIFLIYDTQLMILKVILPCYLLIHMKYRLKLDLKII